MEAAFDMSVTNAHISTHHLTSIELILKKV